jgi:hypothetical protein
VKDADDEFAGWYRVGGHRLQFYAFPDGTVSEHWPMTARAADAHRRGDVRFAAEPVGLRE